MKKSLWTVVIAIILVFSMLIPVSALNQDFAAEELNSLGLFLGTDQGFELDAAPTRGQAAIMLIRLLGLEEEALGGGYEHPFDDVPEWLDGYIGFSYENDLVAGMTGTTFAPYDLCTAQMYATLVLRALGYSDAEGDFAYAEAIPFGQSVGIIDTGLASEPFLRNEMVGMSYLALAAAPKGGEFDTLLEKLVSDGAVDETAAEAMLERIRVYNEFALLGFENVDEKRFAVDIAMEMDMGDLGSTAVLMEMSMILEEDDVLAAIATRTEAEGEEIAVEMFIADGYLYTDMDGMKIKMDAGLAGYESLLAVEELGEMTLNPFYLIKSIAKSEEDELTAYALEFVDGFVDYAMVQAMSVIGEMPAEAEGLEITITQMVFYADSGGGFKGLSASIEMMTEAGPVSVVMEMLFTAFGDDVAVTLPDDLDEYELFDIESLMAAEAE